MTTLLVPDMTCGHCKATVEAALKGVSDTGAVEVDLASHLVRIPGAAPAAALIAALDKVGYPATVVPG